MFLILCGGWVWTKQKIPRGLVISAAMPHGPVSTGSWAFMAMEQPEGSNSNTYRPVFALLQTHPRFSFFSACFIRIWGIIGHRHDKTSQATTSFRADWAKHEHLKAGMHVLFGR